MKAGVVILLVALAGALFVSGIVLAQGGGSTQPGVTTLSGGHYRLVSLEAPTGLLASGGGYRLLASLPAGPVGSGCCCTYLPCVLRTFP